MTACSSPMKFTHVSMSQQGGVTDLQLQEEGQVRTLPGELCVARGGPGLTGIRDGMMKCMTLTAHK